MGGVTRLLYRSFSDELGQWFILKPINIIIYLGSFLFHSSGISLEIRFSMVDGWVPKREAHSLSGAEELFQYSNNESHIKQYISEVLYTHL